MTSVKSFPEIINGERIYLKKHDVTAAAEMFHAIDKDRERLSQFMPWPAKTLTIKDSKNWILLCIESWKQRAMFDYGIYLMNTHQYIGNIGVHSIDWRNSRCELGYWIGSDHERNGYISEAVRVLEKICFEMDFHRIEIRCSGKNLKSANVASRNGYKLEGYLRDEKIDHGEYDDQFIFAKIKSEKINSNFVTFLGLDFIYLFVEDVQASKEWYQKVFNEKPETDLPDFVQFRLGSSGLCLHFADTKSPFTTGGSVGYWRVANFEMTLDLFKKNDAQIYRGPLKLPTSEQICQIKDPFGNIIGFVGPAID